MTNEAEAAKGHVASLRRIAKSFASDYGYNEAEELMAAADFIERQQAISDVLLGPDYSYDAHYLHSGGG